ncbi:MAG: acyl carrier protein [Clostridiales bacterium]|nr:acyl carrier protein [Clostridiales bacterium]
MDVIIEILKELHPDVDYETNTSLVDDRIIDSFDIISIVAEIDDRLDVQIPAEEIIPDNFNSAAALAALVKKLEDED